MTAPLSDAELAAIEARAGNATPGPWRVGVPVGARTDVDEPHRIDEWLNLCAVYGDAPLGALYEDAREIVDGSDTPPSPYDCQFIAAARTDVPALVAALRDAYAQLAAAGGYEAAGLADDVCAEDDRAPAPGLAGTLGDRRRDADRRMTPTASASERTDTERLDWLLNWLPFPVQMVFGGDEREMRQGIDAAIEHGTAPPPHTVPWPTRNDPLVWEREP